ncbi:hypothetical protein BC938DRAFT_482900 [Jimgerdemannia flammicorona]|uniref:Uncharacterized protein n=1 Tax=Jimgerdemannia flammicorona TaxID=994334 RepID=A0A433R0P5_9FUNG|nr:hypothetical protein BC938DRAFT_482900 [Jimgerdemannia flammicorona]
MLLTNSIVSSLKPPAALHDIVQRAIVEIRKYGFGDDIGPDAPGSKFRWTDVQFFQVMSALGRNEVARADAPFHGMENAELITIVHKDGKRELNSLLLASVLVKPDPLSKLTPSYSNGSTQADHTSSALASQSI